MNEDEYRDTYHSVNTLRCCYEKAILTRRFGCQHLQKINLADREAAGCQSEQAQVLCQGFLRLTRSNAAFALKAANTNKQLPHAKEIKAQCGGILGLNQLLDQQKIPADTVENIYTCIEAAIQKFGSLELIPFSDIIHTISHFQGRKKRNRK